MDQEVFQMDSIEQINFSVFAWNILKVTIFEGFVFFSPLIVKYSINSFSL